MMSVSTGAGELQLPDETRVGSCSRTGHVGDLGVRCDVPPRQASPLCLNGPLRQCPPAEQQAGFPMRQPLRPGRLCWGRCYLPAFCLQNANYSSPYLAILTVCAALRSFAKLLRSKVPRSVCAQRSKRVRPHSAPRVRRPFTPPVINAMCSSRTWKNDSADLADARPRHTIGKTRDLNVRPTGPYAAFDFTAGTDWCLRASSTNASNVTGS